MDWITPLLPVLLEHLVLPALLAFGAYLVTLLPGPLRQWLASATHARDMELLLGALMRSALASLPDLAGSRITAAEAARRAAEYARANLPDTLAKLQPSPETLQAMAKAAVTQALRPGEGAKR
ncbi:hypothetical protein [Pseudoroseomonas cervicalis]|uniref:hypothetical protein n=1 Tax=Teichococcus cervicalis TaxID=204525 RepID=UPI0027879BD0|nr:hypothetical protein [Pseudoroseomonas cervicalis]MDQ1079684.1 hypothetical protein [Pseudoroseomonas cervicalis]